MLISFRQQNANPQYAANARTHQRRFDEIVAFLHQDLCDRLWTGEHQPALVAIMKIMYQAIIRNFVDPSLHRNASGLLHDRAKMTP